MQADRSKIGALGWAWAGGVVVFSVVRALVAWPTLGRYGVDPWVFVAIDVLTAFPYAVGQVLMVKAIVAKDWAGAQLWTAVVLCSFVAPYAYIFIAGAGQLPLWGYLIVAALVVVLGAASALRLSTRIRAAQRESAAVNNDQRGDARHGRGNGALCGPLTAEGTR